MRTQLPDKITLASEQSGRAGRLSMAGVIHRGTGVTQAVRDGFVLCYVTSGRGEYADSRHGRIAIEAGDLITVPPGLRHSYGPTAGNHWSEVFVIFDGPAFSLWHASGLLSTEPPVRRVAPLPYWRRQLARFVETSREARDRSPDAEVCRLLTLLTELHYTSLSGDDVWLERARVVLSRDLSQRMDLAGIARSMGLGYDTFRVAFRKHTGVPPAKFRMLRQMDAARELLARTQMTNAQIAEELGITDSFYFSSRFKKLVGVSPQQYRSQTRGGSLRGRRTRGA